MLFIYDSLTGQKREFNPITPGEITMYVCGQTVYDYCHVGHARAMITFDTVVRYLRSQNYKVTFVRNITDIDDKIIQRANENHETCEALTTRFIEIMHEDEKALGLLPVDHEPHATQFIVPIVQLIEQLIAKKIAYIAGNGDVCFAVKQFKTYGKLSKRDLEKLIAGARVDITEGKKDPLDFVLWKLSKPGEPTWESPWGVGRPGWHIECSAMAAGILGQPFDIHGGGMDLKFPHHENEIAQSEAAHHKTFANTWMHIGLLNVNDEKMSKSLKNFFTIREVLAEHHPEVVRYFMLSAHYRSPVNYSKDNLAQASQALIRLYTAIRGLDLSAFTNDEFLMPSAFLAAMNDDFNTPIALSVLFDMAHEISRLRKTNDVHNASKLAFQLKKISEIFGILQQDADTFLKGDVSDMDVKKIEDLITARNHARHNKNWAEADRIRDELQRLNVIIEDDANGTTWRRM